MKEAGKIVRIVGINLVLLLFLLEIAGVGVFFFREGQLFYRRSSPDSPSKTVRPLAAPRFVLHPVLGFIRRPATPLTDLVARTA